MFRYTPAAREADGNQPNIHGRSPLHAAANQGRAVVGIRSVQKSPGLPEAPARNTQADEEDHV